MNRRYPIRLGFELPYPMATYRDTSFCRDGDQQVGHQGVPHAARPTVAR